MDNSLKTHSSYTKLALGQRSQKLFNCHTSEVSKFVPHEKQRENVDEKNYGGDQGEVL